MIKPEVAERQIRQLARYQVRPEAVERCLAAIHEFVAYVSALTSREPFGTKSGRRRRTPRASSTFSSSVMWRRIGSTRNRRRSRSSRRFYIRSVWSLWSSLTTDMWFRTSNGSHNEQCEKPAYRGRLTKRSSWTTCSQPRNAHRRSSRSLYYETVHTGFHDKLNNASPRTETYFREYYCPEIVLSK